MGGILAARKLVMNGIAIPKSTTHNLRDRGTVGNVLCTSKEHLWYFMQKKLHLHLPFVDLLVAHSLSQWNI